MSDNRKNKHNNFLMQAGILAAAGIISRIIGLLYRSPLTAVVGDLGMGYYQAAYHIYTIVLLISSYSIPSAISKVIAQKLAVREYRNAHRIFICSIWYVLGVGAAASLILFFGAPLVVSGPAVTVLRVFAPTVFLYGLLGVLRGYFQAHSSMVQTSVSQILEQIANAVISIAAAYLLIHTFVGTSETTELAGEEYLASRAMFGAAGSALGTCAGVLVGLLFMWGIYLLNRKMFKRRIDRDHTRSVDSYRDISRTILVVVMPFLLSTAAYNLCTPLNSNIFTERYRIWKEIDRDTVYSLFGIFSNKAMTITNIPVAFASAMASAMIPSVAQLIATKNTEGARYKIGMAIKTTMIISIPCAAGLCVLARPITGLLFRQKDTLELASRLLTMLSVTVIFFALSTLSSSILQGIGKVNTPIINAVAALVIQTITLICLLLFTKLDVYALVIATVVYSGLMCILNQISVHKAIGYRQEMVKTFLLPLLASAFMAAFAWAVYEGLYLLSSSFAISVIPAIILGAVIYFILLIVMKGITEQELKNLPKGYLLVKAAKKFRLLR